MSKEKSFEKSIEDLEKIVDALSKDEITLEDSIKKYKEGIELVGFCNGAIDKIEKRIRDFDKGIDDGL